MSECFKVCLMPVASCSLDLLAHPIFVQSFQETFIQACNRVLPLLHLAKLGLPSLGFKAITLTHLALTRPSDDAYASAAPDANQAKLFQALGSIISNALLLQACCQARLPSRTHSQPIRIWHSHLLLTTPVLPSITAMPNNPELHAKIFFRYSAAASQGFLRGDPAPRRRAVLRRARWVSARPLRSGRHRWAAASAGLCAIRACGGSVSGLLLALRRRG
jgi:hypothetical protein